VEYEMCGVIASSGACLVFGSSSVFFNKNGYMLSKRKTKISIFSAIGIFTFPEKKNK
jgi:hypothetical protein